MEIGGFQEFTLVDYPGKIACTVFIIGCNFRCPWCYSSELVLPEKIETQPRISQKYIFNFFKKRKGLIDGVVICGGEPTISKELTQFIKKIKKMGFLVKLDTNGSNPQTLEHLIDNKLIDYVAMDIKGPKEKYSEVTGVNVDMKNIQKSIDILKEGKIDFEFRTTVVPTIHKKEDIFEIAYWIQSSPKYFLQNFRSEKTIDPFFKEVKPYPSEQLVKIRDAIAKFFDICEVR